MTYNVNQKTLKLLSKIYAESTRRIVLFVGAGCSTDVGLPLWADLRGGLFQDINDQTDLIERNEELLEQLRELEDLFASDNFWSFFDFAAHTWPTIYADSLYNRIDLIAENCLIPEIYKTFWEMRSVRQVFTLNVDCLAARAFREVHGASTLLNEYDGFNLTDSQSFLDRNIPCVMNVHGAYNSKSRWIMNESERQNLYDSVEREKFTAFMNNIFINCCIIFIGIRPTDVSISPFLEKTLSIGLSGQHFWITSDKSPQTHT